MGPQPTLNGNLTMGFSVQGVDARALRDRLQALHKALEEVVDSSNFMDFDAPLWQMEVIAEEEAKQK